MNTDERGCGEEATAEEPRASCPLCGYEMTMQEFETCRAACPMSAKCAMVKCPRCGAEFPRPGPVTRWLERLLRRK